jgi:catechol 2,3-dioxygenase-like lactoylglutathione lyase family enzyme
MIRGVHHVAITTTDIDRLSQFYIDAFGFELISRGGWEPGNATNDSIVGLKNSSASTAFLRAGNLLIEMFQYHAPEGRPNDPDRPVNDAGYTHFCLDVVDIDAEVERLTALGMTWHAPLPEAGQMGGVMRAMYGRDIDGNIIELIEFHDITAPAHVDFDGDPIRA